jgi:hypothetical protein
MCGGDHRRSLYLFSGIHIFKDPGNTPELAYRAQTDCLETDRQRPRRYVIVIRERKPSLWCELLFILSHSVEQY